MRWAEESDLTPLLDQLGLQLQRPQVEEVEADHLLGLGAEPTSGAGARHAELGGDAQIAGLAYQVLEPVVVPSLHSSLQHGTRSSLSRV